MKKILLLFALCSAGVFLRAQSSGELLKETAKAYLDAENLSMDVSVHMFTSATDAGTLMGNGLIRKAGENYYSKFLTDELIINKSCMVVLDHQMKTVTWYDMESERNKKKKDKNQQLPDLDSISNGDSVVYSGVSNGRRHFLFYSRAVSSAIRLTEVFIDDQTHFVAQIVYYYRDNSTEEAYDMYKVVIDYTNISTEKPADSFFLEKKYLSYTKNQPVLNASFSKYKLIIAREP
jgi:hypothetical protein